MDCEQVLRSLYLYLDREDVDCAGIEAHLSACRDCLSHADFERTLKDVVKRACGSAEIPTGLESKVRSLLE